MTEPCTCSICGIPVRDPDTGRWAIPADVGQSLLANGNTTLAYRCPCGATFWEDQAYAPRPADPAMRVGSCRICGRVVRLGDTTDAPQVGDDKVVQIPGWGLACTAHRGVAAFYAMIEGVPRP